MDTEVITEQELDRSGMAFWQSGHQGINLLKIHGALDVFTFKDGKDLLKLRPTGPGVHGVIDALRVAHEELLYIEPQMSRPVTPDSRKLFERPDMARYHPTKPWKRMPYGTDGSRAAC